MPAFSILVSLVLSNTWLTNVCQGNNLKGKATTINIWLFSQHLLKAPNCGLGHNVVPQIPTLLLPQEQSTRINLSQPASSVHLVTIISPGWAQVAKLDRHKPQDFGHNDGTKTFFLGAVSKKAITSIGAEGEEIGAFARCVSGDIIMFLNHALPKLFHSVDALE